MPRNRETLATPRRLPSTLICNVVRRLETRVASTRLRATLSRRVRAKSGRQATYVPPSNGDSVLRWRRNVLGHGNVPVERVQQLLVLLSHCNSKRRRCERGENWQGPRQNQASERTNDAHARIFVNGAERGADNVNLCYLLLLSRRDKFSSTLMARLNFVHE